MELIGVILLVWGPKLASVLTLGSVTFGSEAPGPHE